MIESRDANLADLSDTALSCLRDVALQIGFFSVQHLSWGEEATDGFGGYIDLSGEQALFTIGLLVDEPGSARLARVILGCEPEDPDPALEDRLDAIGEFANIVAGSIKRQLGEVGQEFVISLPWFVSGRCHFKSAQVRVAAVSLGGLPTALLIARRPHSSEHLERRRLAAELKDRQSRIRAVVDSVADGIVTVDEQGLVETLNAAGQQILGCTLGDAIGKPVDQVFGARILVQWAAMTNATHDNDRTSAILEFSCQPKNGVTVPLEISSTQFRLGNTQILVGIFRDVSDRKRLELAVRQAQRLEAVGRLAAGIAHELNTPAQFVSDNIAYLSRAFGRLTALVDMHEQLLRDLDAEQCAHSRIVVERDQLSKLRLKRILTELPGALADATTGVARIAAIVRSMQSFARPNGNRFDFVDLRDLIETIGLVSRHEWEAVADLTIDIERDVPSIVAIRDELNQALVHVIVNAAQAIGATSSAGQRAKGTIGIRVRRRGEQSVEIRISDNGCGIPTDVRDRVFDPFFTTKPVGQGMGQGLHVVYQVVKSHRGLIEIESTEGQGTTVRIELPISLTSATDA